MLQYKMVTLFLLFLLIGKNAFSQKATDDFSGKWKTEEGATVEISRKETGFIGVGAINKKTIVKDLQFKDGNWVSEITNPIKNVTANAVFLIEGNRLKIVAKKGFFSKTIYWTKL